MPSIAPLTTPRLVLRAFTAADAPALQALYTTPSLQAVPRVNLPASASLASVTAQIAAWQRTALLTNVALAVERRADGAFLGQVDFGRLWPHEQRAVAGVVLRDAPDVRRRGYACEALAALLDFGFGFGDAGLSLRRVVFGTAVANAPMRGILERRWGLVGRVEGAGEEQAEAAEEERGGCEIVYTLEKEHWLALQARGDAGR